MMGDNIMGEQLKKYAVIVAGGSGVRMGTAVPKQFLLLHGKPVLWYTLDAFLGAYDDLDIILVLSAEYLAAGRELADSTEAPQRIRIVAGGTTRYHSVYNGLEVIRGLQVPDGGECVIFVHDGVRCLVSRELVHRCYEQALRLGSAIPVVDCRDSVRVLGTGGVMPGGGGVRSGDGANLAAADSEAMDRNRVKLVQTPQTFLSHLLLSSFQGEYREAFTDEAMVVEGAGHRVHLIEGDINNIKITTPVDLAIARELFDGGRIRTKLPEKS
jgi:2-C-methyl-D-erythritol 4-phosphate cytidylyltransferase